jgi:hypothetical protein
MVLAALRVLQTTLEPINLSVETQIMSPAHSAVCDAGVSQLRAVLRIPAVQGGSKRCGRNEAL